VEAGGVEPPSEKVRDEENYVRIQVLVFDHPLRPGAGESSLARLDLDRRLRTEALWPIPQNDVRSPPRELSGGNGYLIN
jgi:hypothetical protein